MSNVEDVGLLAVIALVAAVCDPEVIDAKRLNGEQRKLLSTIRDNQLLLKANLSNWAILTIRKAQDKQKTA